MLIRDDALIFFFFFFFISVIGIHSRFFLILIYLIYKIAHILFGVNVKKDG